MDEVGSYQFFSSLSFKVPECQKHLYLSRNPKVAITWMRFSLFRNELTKVEVVVVLCANLSWVIKNRDNANFISTPFQPHFKAILYQFD